MRNFFKSNRDNVRDNTEYAVRKSRNSWFGRIFSILGKSKLEESFWEELEEILISGDVGVSTSLEIIDELRTRTKTDSLSQGEDVFSALKDILVGNLEQDTKYDSAVIREGMGDHAKNMLPYVILVVGVNGVGKTTSIGKLAHQYQANGKGVIVAAADTFRAAAIDQLRILGDQVGAEVIAHRQGADPGAVAYDAFQAARARNNEVLIIDTAGRLHTKANLMDEMKKIRSVVNRLNVMAPHEVLLVIDATTGHNGLAQAIAFSEAVDCTGIFLTKLDGTAKGGIVLAINKELGLPIKYIGTGETVYDIAPFNPKDFIEALLAPVS